MKKSLRGTMEPPPDSTERILTLCLLTAQGHFNLVCVYTPTLQSSGGSCYWAYGAMPPRENQTTPVIYFSAKISLLVLFIAFTPTIYPLKSPFCGHLLRSTNFQGSLLLTTIETTFDDVIYGLWANPNLPLKQPVRHAHQQLSFVKYYVSLVVSDNFWARSILPSHFHQQPHLIPRALTNSYTSFLKTGI